MKEGIDPVEPFAYADVNNDSLSIMKARRKFFLSQDEIEVYFDDQASFVNERDLADLAIDKFR